MDDEKPDWLPAGWEIEVKVRVTGRKDKYYINPENGLKLSSKPEVLRYLKRSGKDRKHKEARGASTCMVSQKPKIDIEKTVAAQLPPGWIKEIRARKKGSNTKSDAYYIDPVSGSQFRSMQEVARYIESKDSGEAMAKPGGKGHDTLEFGDHSKSSSGEAKGQSSIDKKPDKHLNRNQRLKSGVTHASGVKGGAMKNINMPEDSHLEKREDDSLTCTISEIRQQVNRKKGHADKVAVIKKLTGHQVDKKSADSDQSLKSEVIEPTNVDMQREKEDEFVAGDVLNKSPQVDVKEQVDDGSRRSLRIASRKQKNNVTEDQFVQLGSEFYAEEIIKLSESNDLERGEREENKSTGEGQQHKNPSRQKKRKIPGSKRVSGLHGRTPKRLAQIETENPSLEIKTGKKSGVSATLPDESEATTAKSVVKDGQLDELLNDDANAKIGNDCENQVDNQGQHENLVRQKKRKSPNSRCTSDLLGRTLKSLAQMEIDHPSLEIKTGKKSGVSATLLDESEVTAMKNVAEDGLSDKPMIVDINAEISTDRENPVNNEDQAKNLVRQKRIKIPNRRYGSDLPCRTSKGNGRSSKGLAHVEIRHPSLEVKTSNKSGVSATLTDEAEVTTTKNVVEDGQLDVPLIDDINAEISNDCKNPVNNEDQHENLVRQKRIKIPNRRYESDLPGRTSKGLAKVEIKHPSPEVKTSNKSGVSSTLSDESEVTTTRNVVKDGPSDKPLIDDTNAKISNDCKNPVNNHGWYVNLVCQKSEKIPNSKYGSDLPGRTSKGAGRRTSKGFAQVEIKHPSLEIKACNKSGIPATLSDESEVTTTKNVVTTNEPLIDDNNGKNGNQANNQGKPSSHDCKEDGRESKSINSPLEDLLMDPCIEFAFKTLTGAIPIEEVSKLGCSPVPSLSLPSQTPTSKLPSSQIWSDPCFEFAVKMLTGEMPMEDNSPLVSSLDNAIPSGFDVVRKPSLSQQGVKDPSYPQATSGSSQNTVGARRH